jgi:hypothetical protein
MARAPSEMSITKAMMTAKSELPRALARTAPPAAATAKMNECTMSLPTSLVVGALDAGLSRVVAETPGAHQCRHAARVTCAS